MDVKELREYALRKLTDALDEFEKKLIPRHGRSPFINDYPVDDWVRKMNTQGQRIQQLEGERKRLIEVLRAARGVFDVAGEGTQGLKRAIDECSDIEV